MTSAVWRSKPPHPDWQAVLRHADQPEPMIVTVLTCQQLFAWLSRAQRQALLAHTVGDRVSAHPRVLAALRRHGLTDHNDVLTDAGRLIRRWNLPVRHAQQAQDRSTSARPPDPASDIGHATTDGLGGDAAD